MTVKASPPKKKRGGVRLGPDGKPLQGRRKGIRNKKTTERELLKARKRAHDAMIEEARVVGAAVSVDVAIAANVKLGKEILSDFANVLAGAAAFYQPTPGNKNADEARFLKYSELAIHAADKLAPYQSPRLAAMMIGQTQTKKLAITGGLPSPDDEPVELPPDLYEDSMPSLDDRATAAPSPTPVKTDTAA